MQKKISDIYEELNIVADIIRFHASLIASTNSSDFHLTDNDLNGYFHFLLDLHDKIQKQNDLLFCLTDLISPNFCSGQGEQLENSR